MKEVTLDTHALPAGAPTASAQRRWVGSIDAVLEPLIEIPAALLVVVEISHRVLHVGKRAVEFGAHFLPVFLVG